MDSGFLFEAGALLPSIGVGLIFWFALRALLRADRSERRAEREAEREYRESHDGDEQNHVA
ncbi:hypothetical protein [Brachybacterium sp. YJGR34]|uniref:hypothetical protein n=1 Tax=Brachybacterium sp. YJGR34 TaxID=2059911 RepID=UPI000E0C05BA|nr:hypothetical protein [Brachybacterium sp. YJGR34]